MSFDIVRGIITKPQQTQIMIDKIKEYINVSDDTGTLYLGYPLTANSDQKVTIDAMFLSENHGMICFMYQQHEETIEDIREKQDSLYYHLDYYLKKYSSLRKGRNCVVSPVIITVLIDKLPQTSLDESYILAESDDIVNKIKELPEFDQRYYRVLCEALQKVTSIRPKKSRTNINKSGSKGWIIKEIEKEIANLDEWQKKAALELPNGPQRIRGLAGTGKTIVLALKAAYLHTQYPEWNILITFYTRSLKQQYEELIEKFTVDFSGERPDWNKVQLLHAWGSRIDSGVYYNCAQLCNAPTHTFSSAKSKFGQTNPFKGMCEELLTFMSEDTEKVYDAILIDEAQDLPGAFFKIIYKVCKDPKRIIWAYDELQNLTNMEMPSIKEMFGVDSEGNSIINIENTENEPQKDIILPICYRNPPWTLALAHSLGFGIYYSGNHLPIQTFSDPQVWKEIGYSVVNGKLQAGRNVTIERADSANPQYFSSLLDKEDSIISKRFNTKADQYKWVSEQIKQNIDVDELDPDDILVIFPDAYTSRSEYLEFAKYLTAKEIKSFLAGVNNSQDEFRISSSVTCSGIFRAKGNESPMVYIVNAEYCSCGLELVKLRNILFTAITRSRAWVRICGTTSNYECLHKEINDCKSRNYRLEFKCPNQDEMSKIRNLNRERSEEEKVNTEKAKNNIDELIALLEQGHVDQKMLPELDKLWNVVKKNQENEKEEFESNG